MSRSAEFDRHLLQELQYPLPRKGARDREVGRQFILEAKGWNIIRVWSIDFFHDPEAEYARVLRVIKQLLAKRVTGSGQEQAGE